MEIWILLVVVIVIGVGVTAFFLGRWAEGRSGRVKAMEVELEARKKELEEYRAEVTRHFDRTGTLFATLTGSYRDLYHHLAQGCEKLAEIPSEKLFPGTPAELEGARPVEEDAVADVRQDLSETSTEDQADDAGTDSEKGPGEAQPEPEKSESPLPGEMEEDTTEEPKKEASAASEDSAKIGR